MTLLEKTAELVFVDAFFAEKEASLGRPLTVMEKEALPALKQGWQAIAAAATRAPGTAGFIGYEIPVHQKNASALPVVKKRETWQMAIQEQGPGVSLRLKAPSGQALSWRIQGGMPLVGGMPVAAVEGSSATGKSLLKTDVEVFHAGSGKLKFNHYKGSNHDEYVLKRKGTGWQLRNTTAHKGTMPNMPKPKYKEKKKEGLLDPTDETHVWGPKVDGSHNVFHLRKGQAIRAFSHRSSKRNRSGLLEHSHKVPGLMDKKVPDHLDGTVIRAEIFARSRMTGRPLSAESVAGMLNSGVRKSRAAQAAQAPLEVSTFDVARYRGVDMSTAPYSEKLRVLHKVQKEYPLLKATPVARTKVEKLKLLEDVKGGTHPLTEEGIVEWNLHKGVKPVKWKIKPDMDLEIVGTFKTKGGKYSGTHVGGILVKGKKGVVSRVGTGFDDKFRRLAYERPDLIKGRVARITSMGAYPSGKLRVPSFQGLHTEKNDPTELAAIEAAMSKQAMSAEEADWRESAYEKAREGHRLRHALRRREAGQLGDGRTVPGSRVTLFEKAAEIRFVQGFFAEKEASLGRPLTDMEKEALLPALKQGWQAIAAAAARAAAGTKAMAAKATNAATNAAAHPTFQAASHGFSQGMMTGVPSNAISGALAPLLGGGAKKATEEAAKKILKRKIVAPGSGTQLAQRAVRTPTQMATGRALRSNSGRIGTLTTGLAGAL